MKKYILQIKLFINVDIIKYLIMFKIILSVIFEVFEIFFSSFLNQKNNY